MSNKRASFPRQLKIPCGVDWLRSVLEGAGCPRGHAETTCIYIWDNDIWITKEYQLRCLGLEEFAHDAIFGSLRKVAPFGHTCRYVLQFEIANDISLISPMIASDCQWYLICWFDHHPVPTFVRGKNTSKHVDWLNRTLWWFHPQLGFRWLCKLCFPMFPSYIFRVVSVLLFVRLPILADNSLFAEESGAFSGPPPRRDT